MTNVASGSNAQGGSLGGSSGSSASTFMTLARHDLIASVRSIRTLSDFAAEDIAAGDSFDAATHVAKIGDVAQRLHTLIDDLTRFERAHLPSSSTSELLVDLVEEIGEAVVPSTIKATIRIDLEERVWVERRPLGWAIRELVENAVIHRPEAVGSITVDVLRDGHAIVVTVTDDGAGIPEEFWSLVFEPLRSLDREPAGPRSGLGLAIVQRAAEARGGSIRIERSDDSGSVFSLRWPAPVAGLAAADDFSLPDSAVPRRRSTDIDLAGLDDGRDAVIW